MSTDGGSSWTTVAVGLPEPDVSLDPRQFPPGAQVLIRVSVNNGFTRAVATDTLRA